MAKPVSTVDAFVARAIAQAKAEKIKPSTLSLYLLNDGKDLDRLAAGGDIGARKLERAQGKLDERVRTWPERKAEKAAKTPR